MNELGNYRKLIDEFKIRLKEFYIQKIVMDHKDIENFEDTFKTILDKKVREEFLKGYAEYKQQILSFKELEIPILITTQIVLTQKEIEEIKLLTYIYLKYGDFRGESEFEDLKILVASIYLHVTERIRENVPIEHSEFIETQLNGEMEKHLKQEYNEITEQIKKEY